MSGDSATTPMMTLPGADERTRGIDPASIVLAGVILVVGFLTSFTHVRDVAHEHGWAGLTAFAPPVITEVLAAASGANIRWRIKHQVKGLALPISGVLIGLVLSLAANEATATDGFGPTFARLPWGSILALLMPGSSFLALMMLEPMFSRTHAGRAAQAVHAQAVSLLDVVRGEIGRITADTQAIITAFVDEVNARTAATEEDFRSRMAKAEQESRSRMAAAEQEFRSRMAAMDVESRARTARAASVANAQTRDLAAAVRTQMAEVAEAVTDLVAEVIQVNGSVVDGTARRNTFDERLNTTLAGLTASVDEAVQGVEQAKTAGRRASEGVTEVGIRLDVLAAGIGALDAREQERITAMGSLTGTVEGLRRTLGVSRREVQGVSSGRDVRAITTGTPALARSRTGAAALADGSRTGEESSAAHSRTNGTNSAGGSRTTGTALAVRSRTDGSANVAESRTSGAARTDGIARTANGAVRTKEEIVVEIANRMRVSPEWVPDNADYEALLEQTGYGLRWAQMRFKDARDLIEREAGTSPSADDEVFDGEIVDEAEDGA